MIDFVINFIGKSSVLESIVGEDFLPKSDDLCTRRPLNLFLKGKNDDEVLIRAKNEASTNWEKVKDFPELTNKILQFTDDKAGSKGNIVSEPIWVEIEKKGSPEIRLIDLPGIAKNPLQNSEQVGIKEFLK